MKFLFFTDVHDTMKAPSYRKDNYHETVLKKLAWIGDYASEYDYDFCVCGGDLFDTPGVSNATISSVAKCIRNHFGIPLFAIAGNHDLYGNNSYNIAQTAFGVLSKTGVIKNLCDPDEMECVWRDEKGQIVRIIGVESRVGIDDTPDAYLLKDMEKPEGEVWILVIHGMLREQKSSIFKSTGIRDIITTKADIILSGHDHGGFPILHQDGKIFANPGALLRVTTATSDVNLDVKIVSVQVEPGEISVDYITLPETVALPAKEVLDVERAAYEKKSRQATQDFADRLSQISKHMITTDENALDTLQKQLGFSDEIKEILQKYLSQAEEQLKEE